MQATVRLWHVTERARLARRQKLGIPPTSRGDFGSAVYTWRSLADARKQATSGEGWAWDLQDPVILEIQVPRSWARKLDEEEIMDVLGWPDDDDVDPADLDYYEAIALVDRPVPAHRIVKVLEVR